MKKLKDVPDISFQKPAGERKIVKKLFDKVFLKFILVGILNTLFGTAIMFCFYNVFHFSYWISSAANYVFGSVLSYFLNKYITFQNKERNALTIVKFVINITVCYGIAYGIAKPLAAHILSGYAQSIQENGAMLAGMCLFVMLNYLGQRFFAFKQQEYTVSDRSKTKKQ